MVTFLDLLKETATLFNLEWAPPNSISDERKFYVKNSSFR
jgi:hypothetical protein